jgi:TetR/AcrR family transcriptional regulator, ethionamide resistance regulator
VTGDGPTRYAPRLTKGDERRERLLGALRELLEHRALDGIGIAEISRAAGVTRSAFYFYFPTKAAAVAALLFELRDRIVEAGEAWYGGAGGTPAERVRGTVSASVRLWRGEAALMAAMLDAAGQDPEVRQAWRSWTDEFVERIAARIEQDRAAGLVGATSPPSALATALMGATLHSMEHDVRAIAAGREPAADLPDALVELWFRTLYA